MTLTVKLDERTEKALDERCRRAGETKSAVIRRLIEGYIAERPLRSPAEVYDEVTGGRAPASDTDPVSRDHSRTIKAKLRARNGNR
jgi:predicted DNA-binding protein